eukprot:jgi/Galph1/3295/GphlegSOOS_G2005.1
MSLESPVNQALDWLQQLRKTCEQLFCSLAVKTSSRPPLQSTPHVESHLEQLHGLQTKWSEIIAECKNTVVIFRIKLTVLFFTIVETHRQRQQHLDSLLEQQEQLDMNVTLLLETLHQASETLHQQLEEAKSLWKGALVGNKPTVSSVLEYAVRVAGAISAPPDYQEDTGCIHFTPAPTEEMIRSSKMARWSFINTQTNNLFSFG